MTTMPVGQPVTNPGNAPVIKVGQTASGKFGSEPNAVVLGGKTQPAPLDYK